MTSAITVKVEFMHFLLLKLLKASNKLSHRLFFVKIFAILSTYNIEPTQTDEIRIFRSNDVGEAVRGSTASRLVWEKNAKVAVMRRS